VGGEHTEKAKTENKMEHGCRREISVSGKVWVHIGWLVQSDDLGCGRGRAGAVDGGLEMGGVCEGSQMVVLGGQEKGLAWVASL